MKNCNWRKKHYSKCTRHALTLTMMNPDLSHFENSVGTDQLASQKPADQDPHCFSICIYIDASYFLSVLFLLFSINLLHLISETQAFSEGYPAMNNVHT